MKVGDRDIELTHTDKVLYPGADITKGDVIDYYKYIADRMVPHIENRPLMLHRYPNGIKEGGFYQKDAGDYFPDWMEYIDISKREGGSNKHVVGTGEAMLVYLANQAALEFHHWLSTTAHPDRPDKMVIDLDPPGDDFDAVRQAALLIKELCGELKIHAFPMTTGSSGLHLAVPLQQKSTFKGVKKFARTMGETLVEKHPNLLTLEQLKKNRKGRIYFDYLRNSKGQTSIAPWSLRALPGAPIATPLDWKEVEQSSLHPRKYHIGNIRQRLAQKENPWKGWRRHAVDLGKQ